MTTPVDLIFRDAMAADLPQIVKLLSKDPLGKKREHFEDPLPQSYWDAFAAITADPRSKLVVVEKDRHVVGALQLTFMPGLTFQGAERLLIEAANIVGDKREEGIREAMISHAIDAAKARGCRFVTITSHKSRRDAHAFYENFGFEKTHHGFRYEIEK
jgi:GNAT superfamily N-acetyltransferase